jgi:phosphotransferase system HPr-like phosphotransfer protein
MNSLVMENSIPFETDYEEHRCTVKIPREMIRKRILAAVVRRAEVFQSDILFNAGTFHINGKSPLMAFTLLNALKGQTVEVIARGPDSARAVEELSVVFERRMEARHEAA